jgi:hypothetical protein
MKLEVVIAILAVWGVGFIAGWGLRGYLLTRWFIQELDDIRRLLRKHRCALKEEK